MMVNTRNGEKEINILGQEVHLRFCVPCDPTGKEQRTGTRKSQNWQPRSMSFAELDEFYYSKHEVVNLEHAVYAALPKEQRIGYKDKGAVLYAELMEGQHQRKWSQKQKTIKFRTAFNFDIENRHTDNNPLPSEAVERIHDALQNLGVAYIMHNTLSHCTEEPRLRVIIPADAPIPPDDYEKLGRFLSQYIGYTDYIDDASYSPAQLMYLPAACKDVTPIHYSRTDRPFISVKTLNDEAPDLPEKKVSRKKKQAEQTADAEEKDGVPKHAPGIIGIVNRHFGSVRNAMVCYDMPYNYQQEEQPLLYDNSTSGAPGVYLNPDANGEEEQYFYSFHRSDPAGLQSLDAYGLIGAVMYGITQKVKEDPEHPDAEREKAKQSYWKDLMKIPEIKKAWDDLKDEESKELMTKWKKHQAAKKKQQSEEKEHPADNLEKPVVNDAQDPAQHEAHEPDEEQPADAADGSDNEIDYDALTQDDILGNKQLYKSVIRLPQMEKISAEAMLKNAAKRLKIDGGAGIVGKMLKAVAEECKTVTVQQIESDSYSIACFTGADAKFQYHFRYPSWYECSDRGVIGYKPGLLQYPITIFQHPVLVTGKSVDIDSNEVSYKVSWCRSGEGWKTTEYLPGASIDDARHLLPILANRGIHITTNTATMAAAYIADMIEANRGIPTEHTTKRMGWRDDGCFIPYADGVTLNAQKNGTDGFIKSVRTQGSYETWLNAVKPYRDGKHIELEIIMAAAFASVLVPFTCGLSFIVHLWESQSGAGKTVALMVAASIWGNPAQGKYMTSMNTTPFGLEVMDDAANNLPIIADELQTIANNANISISKIVYMQCAGQGKTRGSKNGGLQDTHSWLNVLVSSGEEPLTTEDDREGAMARVINVSANGKIFGSDEAAMKMAQTVTENYGYAGAEFIKAMQKPGVLDMLRVLFNQSEERKALVAADVVGKQLNDAVLLLITSRIMEKVIFHDGHVLSVKDLLPYLVTNKQIDVNRRAFDWFKEHIAAHSANFIHVSPVTEEPNGYHNGGTELARSNECWGKLDLNEAWQLLSVSFITSIARREFKAAGYDYLAFAKWAEGQGISSVDAGRHDKCVKIARAGNPHCLVIDLEKVTRTEQMSLTEVSEEDGKAWDDLPEVSDEDIPY